MKVADKRAVQNWDDFIDAIKKATNVDWFETDEAKRKRLAHLEAEGNELEWMKYMFPNFCTAPFGRFHRRALTRLIKNKRWFQLLQWSRELGKSTFVMMVVLYLALVKKEFKNVVLVSNSYDNAVRLLLPYKLSLANNQRIINDYGVQERLGSWTDGEFVTRLGVSFRALGVGQSPRGTRNENFRVDCILMDDVDTDEKCRNPRRVQEDFKWFQEALIPTISVSGNYRIIVVGNKIAKASFVTLCEKLADHVHQVNIRDKNGKSTWPEKNSEADIDKVLSLISYTSAQKEYFNNPISEGTVFKELQYRKLPPLTAYKFLVCYTDPSFKDSKKNDFKATWLVGRHKDEYHVIKGFLDQTSTSEMVKWHYAIDSHVNGKSPIYYFMEANFLQDTLLQEFYKVGENEFNKVIPIRGDHRKKPDKFTRIESLLEPLNRNGKLIFNEAEQNNPHMQRLEEQFLALEPGSSAHDDGPDAIEGAAYIINSKVIHNTAAVSIGKLPKNSKRF